MNESSNAKAAKPQASLVPSGYKQTEVGLIPGEWHVCCLSDISTQITDGDHQTPIRQRSGYYLLSARNVQNGRIDLSDVDYVGESEFLRMRTRCGPEFGDILISCSGSIGRVALVPAALKCVLVRSAALVRVCVERADSTFLQFWLQSKQAQWQIASSVNQGAQPNLFLNQIQTLYCPLPPLPEQRAIAAALSDVDALLDGLDRVIAKKRAIKQATMQQLLTGRTRLPGFSGAWEVKRLGDVAVIKTGSRNNDDKTPHGDYPFFVRSEVIERINSYSYDCEAILVPGEGRIGDIFHYINGRFDVHQRVYAISQFEANTSAKFVHLYMAMHFGGWAMQNTVKATVDSLRLPTFQTFSLRIPPSIAEQTAIANVLSDMDAELEALEVRRQKTQQLKQGMMQELLTG
ncbi:MAG: restriction endonuclease subunit S, partial [Myxococcales bacterium]|nr:restriction endonuclease subunit S [Myxococcales bacterium]